MRCPKCQYISFDSGERCRNCGYEFSFSKDDGDQLEVTIGRDEPRPGRVRDISLTELDTPLSLNRPARDTDPDLDVGPSLRRPMTAADLPLFIDRVADDQAPLVTPPAVPRQPLSVRRANTVPRPRRNPLPEELSLDLDAEQDVADSSEFEAPPPVSHIEAQSVPAAGIIRRFTAGLIDAIIVGAIQVGVVYLTLRACELEPSQWRALPVMPLGAFLLLLSGGYFVLFTAAGGQTIGKMITRIRVVAVRRDGEDSPRVSFSAALLRAVAAFGSVLALGTGFLPILFSADRRAFHDRVAETRVVAA
jgi:uncharacterized RDD family membrane protein YckC